MLVEQKIVWGGTQQKQQAGLNLEEIAGVASKVAPLDQELHVYRDALDRANLKQNLAFQAAIVTILHSIK